MDIKKINMENRKILNSNSNIWDKFMGEDSNNIGYLILDATIEDDLKKLCNT